MSLRALHCPSCGAPVAVRARACAYCAVSLVDGTRHPLERGAVCLRYALDKGAYLPGTEGSATPLPSRGLSLSIPAGRTINGVLGPGLRDAALSIEATVESPFTSFGVMARVQDVGPARTGWMLLVRPAHQAFSVARFANIPSGLSVEAIYPWQPHAAVRALGERNHAELRCADAWFDVLINGQPVLGFEDARYAFGVGGWQVTSYEQASRVVVHSFEVAEIE